ncbi:MAG TPA: glycosyltransferase 87 family protein [Candidatus Dormibacteraeota bacterium]
MKGQRDPLPTCIIAVTAVLAAGITAYQLTRPGFLFGITPDISAWLGGSIRLVHGALPYRDFDLVQPPGFTLLASPFAFLSEWVGTRDALAVLRLCTPLLSAGSVLLIGMVIRHRGRAATIVACGVMAFYPAEVYALHSGLLESVVDFFCVAGLALVFDGDGFSLSRRRILLGGVAFGIACCVKAPAVVPVFVVGVLCLSQLRQRLVPFVGGTIAGFAIPTLPFFVLAPGAFIRDVVSPLLSIPNPYRVPDASRLSAITGTAAFGGGDDVAILATVVIVVIVIAAFVLPPRRPAPLEWFAIAATALGVVAQLGPSYYFENYAAFMAPLLALLLAIAVARLIDVRSPRTAVVLATAVIGLVFVNQLWVMHASQVPDIAGVVDAVVPAGSCTLSDAPSKLVTTNRFVATDPGTCNDMIDPEGATLAFGFRSAGAQHLWTVEVEHADYLVTSTPFAHWDIPPGPALNAYVATNFRLIQSGGLLFYVRNGFPAG